MTWEQHLGGKPSPKSEFYYESVFPKYETKVDLLALKLVKKRMIIHNKQTP